MSRQRLTIGTLEDVGRFVSPNGRVVARAGYRDWDGKTPLVQATGDTRKSAERALKAKLADRSLFQPPSSAQFGVVSMPSVLDMRRARAA